MIYNLQKNLALIGKNIIKPDRSFSFNSYLIKEEKNVLIDTLPEKASEVFWQELESLIPLENIDAIIINHSEEDHSGALGYIIKLRNNIPIYCTEPCYRRLKDKYAEAVNWNIVKNNQVLSLGENLDFRFYETPGLHWDDNMVTYWENEQVIFSNDLFGQSIGKEIPLDFQVSEAEFEEALKEYYNKVFLGASSNEKKIIKELLKIDYKLIAPGHGLVIKDRKNNLNKIY